MKLTIDSLSFSWIEVYKCNYDLGRNNSGPVVCRDCKGEIPAGIGIHRRAYKRNGYLCFVCLSKDMTILTTRYDGGDSGFFIDTLRRLRACSFSDPMYSTPEIINLIYNAIREEAYTSIDILLGSEGAPLQAIEDLADSLILRGVS